jgi:hypothetical protein
LAQKYPIRYLQIALGFGPQTFVVLKLKFKEELSGQYLICKPNNIQEATAYGTSAKRWGFTSTAQQNLPHADRINTTLTLNKIAIL